MATSDVEITAGTGTPVATRTISEDAKTKNLQRINIDDAVGADAMGLVTASPGATTLLGRLKTIADGIASLVSGAISVGQAAMAASLPVAIANNQTWTGATNLAKAEDVASADGDVGVGVLAVRKATAADTSGNDGDYEFLQISGGFLRTSAKTDQTTPGATDRVTAGKSSMVNVTLTCDTSALGAGDVIADSQVISNFFRLTDGGGVMLSLTAIDEDDNGAAIDVYFLDANVAMGTENSPPSISDTNVRNYATCVSIGTGDYKDLGGAKVATIRNLSDILTALSGTKDLAVAVVNGSGTQTYTASGLKLRIGVVLD